MAKPKAPPVVNEINVTPMVDVMLVLLIIFMLIIPKLNQKVPITLVKTKNDVTLKDANKDNAIIISITRDGKVFLAPGNELITDPDSVLASKVADLQKDRTDKTVYIKADTRTRFGAVTSVLDDIRKAQVQDLAFITESISGRLSGEPAPTTPAKGAL
jgi:biopolymer transport protein ExbD/biopolymer transport protein TolR